MPTIRLPGSLRQNMTDQATAREQAEAIMQRNEKAYRDYKDAEKIFKKAEKTLLKLMKEAAVTTVALIGKIFSIRQHKAAPAVTKIGAKELIEGLVAKGYSEAKLKRVYDALMADKTKKNKEEAEANPNESLAVSRPKAVAGS